jgi:hypothetical protein
LEIQASGAWPWPGSRTSSSDNGDHGLLVNLSLTQAKGSFGAEILGMVEMPYCVADFEMHIRAPPIGEALFANGLFRES